MSDNNNPIITGSSKQPELALYSGMNQVFSFTQEYIDGMHQGDRITVNDLTDKVAAKTGMVFSKTLSLVSMFLHQCKDITIETGRNGGVFKGKRMKREDKRPRCETCHQVLRPKVFNSSNPELSPLV